MNTYFFVAQERNSSHKRAVLIIHVVIGTALFVVVRDYLQADPSKSPTLAIIQLRSRMSLVIFPK